MRKVIVDFEGQVELFYDRNSKEFKEALKGFREVIDEDGTENNMLQHTAFNIVRFGYITMVEGVGYVGYDNEKPKGEPFSGIYVGKDYDEMDFNIR